MIEGFHPIVSTWLEQRFGEPTEPQQRGWPPIQRGENVLIAAPTGSGKTLAAFLSSINDLVCLGTEEALDDATRVLYVSPLKALANDIRQNLIQPLKEMRHLAQSLSIDLPELRTQVRTGDSSSYERRRTLERPPHILVTTPETFFILLTSAKSREVLRSVRTVIVDEIHALARDKRGSHLMLSLERLECLTGQPFQRIGLSATQKPIRNIARFLVGKERGVGVVDVGHRRPMEVRVEVPGSELGSVATHEIWEEIYQRIAELSHRHRTTLVFVNTRRLAERSAHRLADVLGPERVAAHHGSLARQTRFAVEKRLKEGDLKVVVATASLELGIDIGSVELVCQIGSTRSISLALQRIGRSGHWRGATPKGRIFATTRDEVMECAALVDSMRRGELDRIRIPEAPLDVLAQQIVAAAAADEWGEEALFETVTRAAPYESLKRSDFDALITVLSEGIAARGGRRGAYLHRDRVNGKIRGRRGARIAALTSGGAIPDNANYLVKADPDQVIVGDVDEDFAVESSRGEIFLLGNTSWRIRRIEAGVVRVEDARGAVPTVPFWRGEAPGRSDELSASLSRLKEKAGSLQREGAVAWLMQRGGLCRRGAQQAVDYLGAGKQALGIIPSQGCIVAERFFDESGGMQLVLHAPFGSRINKAWGLALRKRFCRSFNFELQAAATEDGIVISLSDQHSFPLDSVFAFLNSDGVEEVLVQALLAVPLFGVRWRWNATRALAVLRFSGGRKVPPPLQRMRSDDLLATVFPQQAACLEHIHGDIEIPDHVLIRETVRDCLTEAMDLDGLRELLGKIERNEIRCVAVDTREPSPLCHEILNANPYAYLDEAPLEERRTRAVQARRTLPAGHDAELATLDREAIEQVAEDAWPPCRDADEVHDALLSLGVIPLEELSESVQSFDDLIRQSRAFRMRTDPESPTLYAVAAERLGLARKAYPELELDPPASKRSEAAQWSRDAKLDRESAVTELIRCRLQCTGPGTAAELTGRLSLPEAAVLAALHQLEAEGQVLRGSFRPGRQELEWCDRRLLARIHRLTLGRLRREIEPASAADFMRFLLRWQHVAPGTQFHGQRGTGMVLDQLQGFESAAAAWESFLLPARIPDYQEEFLDRLCLSGQFCWGRLTPPFNGDWMGDEPAGRRRVRPSRLAPLAFFRRREMPVFVELAGQARADDGLSEDDPLRELVLSHPAREVFQALHRWGACFFQDLVEIVGRLPVEIESGLWELVASGLVTADGFANLRALISRRQRLGGKHRPRESRRRRQNLSTGRWTLLRLPRRAAPSPSGSQEPSGLEPLAWQLLRRWGVVFRDMLARESVAPPWRDLLMVYRRLEIQGRIRGGRFVSGFAGEQFALPEAVDALRTARRNGPDGRVVRVSASDPLNLIGIVVPGPKVRPHPETFVYYRDGQAVDPSEWGASDAARLEDASKATAGSPVQADNRLGRSSAARSPSRVLKKAKRM